MKARDRRFDGFGVAGGTMSCHYDNFGAIGDGGLVGLMVFDFQCSMYQF